MESRQFLTVVGTGLTTALLTTILVISVLPSDLAGTVGFPAGAIAGLVAVVGLGTAFDGLGELVRRIASAYAAFGFSLLLLFGVTRVILGGDADVSVRTMAGMALVGSLGVFVWLWWQDRTAGS